MELGTLQNQRKSSILKRHFRWGSRRGFLNSEVCFFFYSSMVLRHHSAEAFFESSIACCKLSFASSNVGSIFIASIRSLIASWYLPKDYKQKYHLDIFWPEKQRAMCILLIRYIRAKSI